MSRKQYDYLLEKFFQNKKFSYRCTEVIVKSVTTSIGSKMAKQGCVLAVFTLCDVFNMTEPFDVLVDIPRGE